MNSTCVIGVAGGSGGVGASVLACALAVRAAAADLTAVCVDANRFGGGLDVAFGLEQDPGLRWPDLAGAQGRIDGSRLATRLPTVERVSVLSFDRLRDASLGVESLTEVVTSLAEAADVVVLDLPGPGDALFEAWTGLADIAVLVVGPEVRALASASCVAPALSRVCAEVWLCLRGMARGDLGDAVSSALDLPLLTSIPDDGSLRADLLHGIPPGASGRDGLARAADHVLSRLLSRVDRVAS